MDSVEDLGWEAEKNEELKAYFVEKEVFGSVDCTSRAFGREPAGGQKGCTCFRSTTSSNK